MEFLEDARVGCRVSSGRVRVDEDRDAEEVLGQESEEDGPGMPQDVFLFPFSFSFVLFDNLSLSGGVREQETGLPQYNS